METFALKEYTDRAETLLGKTKQAFGTLELSADTLPSTMQPKDGPVKLVFVGQYSAGKSSIIKMLTGLDVETGGGITTQQSHVYQWGDIEIVDTPGIQTGVRPDHDEITYGEIHQAALLVFVVTNEGFDRHMGAHFQKLAIEQKRGPNMMLIVNKMDRANLGNTAEQQAILREDIVKVVAPLTPENLYTTFVSTESYAEAQGESDAEIRQDLLAESGYAELVAHLNAFVKAKNLTSRVIEPVYTLKSVLDELAGTPQDDQAADKAEELLKRKQRIYHDAEKDALNAVQDLTMNLQSDIKLLGKQTASCIPAESEAALKTALEEKTQQVGQLAYKCQTDMEEIVRRMAQEVDAEVAEVAQSDFAQGVLRMADGGAASTSIGALVPLEAGERGGESVLPSGKTVTQKLSNLSLNEAAQKAGNGVLKTAWEGSLKNFSGSVLHESVKSVGKLFGLKFAPWQAVKWAKVLGVAGAIASILWTIYDAVQSEEKRQEQERALVKARQEITQQFDEWAEGAYAELSSHGRDAVHQVLATAEQDVTEKLTAIDEARQLQAKRQQVLSSLQQETDALIDEMEA